MVPPSDKLSTISETAVAARRRIMPLFLFLAPVLQACGGHVAAPVEPDRLESRHIALLDISRIPIEPWWHLKIKGQTNYRIVTMDGHLAIRAEGAGGASGLIRRTAFSPAECGIMRWTWRVNRLQAKADLTTKQGDDVGAAIFVLFGDPGLLSAPDPVPTLRYVWTAGRHRPGAVLANPFFPETVRNIVVRAGSAELGQWMTERRDLRADFRMAFGKAPHSEVNAIALFVDNDQTKEPVEAYFRRIDVACR